MGSYGINTLLPSIHLEAIRLRLYVLTLTVSGKIKQLFIQRKVHCTKIVIYLIVWLQSHSPPKTAA